MRARVWTSDGPGTASGQTRTAHQFRLRVRSPKRAPKQQEWDMYPVVRSPAHALNLSRLRPLRSHASFIARGTRCRLGGGPAALLVAALIDPRCSPHPALLFLVSLPSPRHGTCPLAAPCPA